MFATIRDCLSGILRDLVNQNSTTASSELFLRADSINKFYKNFPYRIEWTDSKLSGNLDMYNYGRKAEEWCKENCQSGYTNHIHQVLKDQNNGEWVINTFGNDVWFWAFKNEQDAIMFSLRW